MKQGIMWGLAATVIAVTAPAGAEPLNVKAVMVPKEQI